MKAELLFYKSKNTALVETEINKNIEILNLALCDASSTMNREELVDTLQTALQQSDIIFIVSGAFDNDSEHIVKIISDILEIPLAQGDKIALNDSITINNPYNFNQTGSFIENEKQVICILPDDSIAVDGMLKNPILNLISMKYDSYPNRYFDPSKDVIGENFSPNSKRLTQIQAPKPLPMSKRKKIAIIFAIIAIIALIELIIAYFFFQ